MANALKNAPSKLEKEFIEVDGEKVVEGSREYQVLSQKYDTEKKYIFELAVENQARSRPIINMRSRRPAPVERFKPYQNIVMTSQIVWNGSRRMIRYYDGCDTIFVDKQPKEREAIEQYIKQTTQRFFEKGKFGCEGYEKMLLLYLTICSWNAESPFRTKTANSIFIAVNADKRATVESAKLDETETALQLAKDATLTKMLIHANYLGIPTVDYDSGNEMLEKEIRTEYRKYALRNSANFIETYGNKSIETKYFIDKALGRGLINNKFNPNKATWASSNSEVCDISGLRSPESIAQKIFEFSQSEAGEEFLIQLKAVIEQ